MRKGLVRTTLIRRLCFLAVLCCSFLTGQQTTGSLEGDLTDPGGAKVPDAQLELQNAATGAAYKQSTGSEGQYVFNLLPPGTYRLVASKSGFQPQTISGILIAVNRSTRVNVALQLGTVVQSVDVSATAALIDVTSAKVSTNVERQFVTELPTITHNALSYAELAPGVQLTKFTNSQVTDIEGAYAKVNGLRQGANAFYLDGSDNNGSFRNGALQFPNELRGSAFYFFRNKNLDANTWARNLSSSPAKRRMGAGSVEHGFRAARLLWLRRLKTSARNVSRSGNRTMQLGLRATF